MVAEALSEMPAWRALDEEARALVFAAAILHDVAKPECTRKDASGHVSARGHSLRGAIVARKLLWRMRAPFAAREAICALVRYHQAPFFLIERDDARHMALSMSQSARCDHLALVAEADARGRVCKDARRLLDNIALFRELCAEQGCVTAPAAFPSAHARLLYLRGELADPTFAPHEAFRAHVTVMSGLPGAGKDTWIKANASDLPVVSLDRLRIELGVDPSEPQGEVIVRARALAREHLRAGRPFVWNATNLSRTIRASCMRLFFEYDARVRIAYVEVPEDVLRGQNASRAAVVPDKVIDRMLDRWEVPEVGEAHELTCSVR
jgi:predicted kinase